MLCAALKDMGAMQTHFFPSLSSLTLVRVVRLAFPALLALFQLVLIFEVWHFQRPAQLLSVGLLLSLPGPPSARYPRRETCRYHLKNKNKLAALKPPMKDTPSCAYVCHNRSNPSLIFWASMRSSALSLRSSAVFSSMRARLPSMLRSKAAFKLSMDESSAADECESTSLIIESREGDLRLRGTHKQRPSTT